MPDDAAPRLDADPTGTAGKAPGGEAASEDYLVAARKYRPALFREVASQGHVTDTLKNALRTGRLAHAYLFSGPRGVGKTTAARILAKAINCTKPLAEREDEAEPCRECESCRSFEEGRSLGIFEIDAASNNGVDDIRELRETVRVPPQGTQKKVYIIDEVHMLSKAAFNALLKTLEEPPPYVLFIFATTEPHKVLPTVLSRCQRFDFRRIRAGRIAEHLRWICNEEGIDADEGALMLLARKGDGALRDALSAFDQAVSLCGRTLRYDALAKALGVVDADLYFRVTEQVREGQSAGMLRLVEEIVSSGYDLQEFLGGLAEHLRNLMVACTMEDASLIEATDARRQRYAQSAKHFSEDDLLRLLMLLGEAEDAVRQSTQPRLRLEMALLNMAALPRATDLQEALGTLRRLEKMAQEGGPLAGLSEAAVAGGGPATAPTADHGEGAAPERAPSATAEDAPQHEAPTAPPAPRSEQASDADDASDAEAQPAPEAPPPTAPAEADSAEDASAEDASAEDASTDAPAPDATPDREETPAPSPPDRDAVPSAQPPEPALSDPSPPAEAASENDGEAAPDAEPGGETPDASEQAPPEYDDLFGAPALSPNASKPSGGDSGDAPQNTAGREGEATATAVVQEPSVSVEASAQEPAGRSRAVEQLRGHWDALVQNVRADRIDLASCLGDVTPVELEAGTLTVTVPNQFTRRFLLDQEAFLLNHVERHLPAGTTEPSTLRFTLRQAGEGDETDAGDTPTDPRALLKQMREDHPVVRAIFEEFGGEIAW